MSSHTKTIIIEMTQADLLALFAGASVARRTLARMPAEESLSHNMATDIEAAQARLARLLLEVAPGSPDLERELRSVIAKGEPVHARPA